MTVKRLPDITQWEVKATLRDTKNGTATGKAHINVDTLEVGEDTM